MSSKKHNEKDCVEKHHKQIERIAGNFESKTHELLLSMHKPGGYLFFRLSVYTCIITPLTTYNHLSEQPVGGIMI